MALQNINLLSESRESVIRLSNDYSSIVTETNQKAKNGKWLKILTPRQIIQRLPIVVA